MNRARIDSMAAGLRRRPAILIERLLDDAHRDILTGFISSFATKLLSSFIQFGQNVIFSRLLGAGGIGLYFLALSVYRVGESIGQIGLQQAVVREVAAHRASFSWMAVRRLWIGAAITALLMGVVAAAATWVAAPLLSKKMLEQPGSVEAIRLVAWGLIPGIFNVVVGAALRGLDRQSASNILGQMMVSIAATGVFVLATSGYGSRGAIIAFLAGQLASAIALAIGAWWFSRHPSATDDRGSVRSLMHSAIPLWLISIASLGNDSIGVLVLGALGTTHDIGLFGVAARLVLLMSFLGASVQAVCEPRLVARYRLNDRAGLVSAYRFSLVLATTIAVGAGLGLAVFAAPILSLFGPEFSGAILPFLAMNVGVSIVTALSPAGSLLVMTGHARSVAIIALVALPLLVVTLIICVPMFGALGAAIATGSVFAFRSIAQTVIAQRLLKKLA